MPIKRVYLAFFGSFQCRLATEPAPTGGSPTAPPSPGDFSLGWTFDFGEARFDRVIRLSSPVALRRDGVLRAWADTKVTTVRVDRGAGLQDAPADPAIGKIVSLGSGVVFDSAAGGGAGNEALPGFELGITDILTATPVTVPRIATDFGHSQSATWRNEYTTQKAGRAGGIADVRRKNHILSSMGVTMYATFYAPMGTVGSAALRVPAITARAGVFQEIGAQIAVRPPFIPPFGGNWSLHVDFFQYDGDTLCGTVNGWLDASFVAPMGPPSP